MHDIFKDALKPFAPKTSQAQGDHLDRLAADIKRLTAEGCARVAEIHIILQPENQFQEGYNAACRAIAAKIREL